MDERGCIRRGPGVAWVVVFLAAIAPVHSRSLKLSIDVDRDGARLAAFTLEDRPFVSPLALPAPEGARDDRMAQIEIVLYGAGEPAFTRRVDVGPLCLEHPAWEEPHVAGDTILLHRDSFVIDLPERAGQDHVEVATYRRNGESLARNVLGAFDLDAAHFVPAGGTFAYRDLAFAKDPPAGNAEAVLTTGDVFWPESFGDPDRTVIYGDASEGWKRTNIVIVPDGYTYAEKTTLKGHADQLVYYFRSKTPYKEHDRFLNYILVYAYSAESGTDQCDCAIIKDTAMATSFPNSTPTCGVSDNRCLYYGSACDPTPNHLAAAELRAPGFDYAMGDRTIVMVNTTRYGGCGGTRAVYSAGNPSATEVAVHELGHSFAGLADEYTAYTTCGSGAGEINTSTNAVNGAWPEWIADLGAPKQGAQYYAQCLYRPQTNCDMRALNQPFCAVCNQRWALVFFGKPRVMGTAPLESVDPYSPTTATVGVPRAFGVGTRFASGPTVTNEIKWLLYGPGYPVFTEVAADTTSYAHTFAAEGSYSLRCQITADTNFVKPSKTGANRATYTWTVAVTLAPPAEVSPRGAAQPLVFTTATTLVWDVPGSSGSTTFDVYRGDLTQLPSASYGSCLASGLAAPTLEDTASPSADAAWFYLVAGRTSGGPGPLGSDSAGNARQPASICP